MTEFNNFHLQFITLIFRVFPTGSAPPPGKILSVESPTPFLTTTNKFMLYPHQSLNLLLNNNNYVISQ